MKTDYKEGEMVEWETVVPSLQVQRTHTGKILKRLELGERTTLGQFCHGNRARTISPKKETVFYREPSFVIVREMDTKETRYNHVSPNIIQHRPASRIRPFSGGLPASAAPDPVMSRMILPPPLRDSVASLGLDGLGSLKAGKEYLDALSSAGPKPEGRFAEIAATTFLDTRGEPEVGLQPESKAVFDRSEYLFRLSKALELGAKTAVAATFDDEGLVVIWAPRSALKRMREVSGLFSDPSGSYKIILFRPMGFWMTINSWEHSRIRAGTAKDLVDLGILISRA